MPRTYIRKTNRQSWSQEEMKKAIADVQEGSAIHRAAKIHHVPEAALRRYIKKYTIENIPKNAGRYKNTFNEKHD